MKKERKIMKNKFNLTDNIKAIYRNNRKIILRQIQANFSFWYIKKGELGGFVENENNLSQTDFSWIYPECYLLGETRVQEDSMVIGTSFIENSLVINSHICNTILYNDCIIKNSSINQSEISNVELCSFSTIENCKISFVKSIVNTWIMNKELRNIENIHNRYIAIWFMVDK